MKTHQILILLFALLIVLCIVLFGCKQREDVVIVSASVFADVEPEAPVVNRWWYAGYRNTMLLPTVTYWQQHQYYRGRRAWWRQNVEPVTIERRTVSDVKNIKLQADIMLLITSGNAISKKREEEIILEVEQYLNSLEPLKGYRRKTGIRVHIKARKGGG